jgi:hypothetical protein
MSCLRWRNSFSVLTTHLKVTSHFSFSFDTNLSIMYAHKQVKLFYWHKYVRQYRNNFWLRSKFILNRLYSVLDLCFCLQNNFIHEFSSIQWLSFRDLWVLIKHEHYSLSLVDIVICLFETIMLLLAVATIVQTGIDLLLALDVICRIYCKFMNF